MSISVQPEVLIARPRPVVAAYMFDPANDAAWTVGVLSARALTPGRLAMGSRVERTVRFLGRTFSYLYEVVGASGDDFVEMTVEKPFPMHIRYELEDAAEGGTRARIRAVGDASGFFKLATPLMRIMVERNIRKDLGQLKARIEAL